MFLVARSVANGVQTQCLTAFVKAVKNGLHSAVVGSTDLGGIRGGEGYDIRCRMIWIDHTVNTVNKRGQGRVEVIRDIYRKDSIFGSTIRGLKTCP